MITPVENQPGLFKDPASGEYISLKRFVPFQRAFDLSENPTVKATVPKSEYWIPERFALALHPWPEYIDPSACVSIYSNERLLIDNMPVFVVAEPMVRDAELMARVERVERVLDVVKNPRTGLFRKDDCLELLRGGSTLLLELYGPITPGIQGTKIIFRLEGLQSRI